MSEEQDEQEKTWKSTGKVWTKGERGVNRGHKRGMGEVKREREMQKSLNAKSGREGGGI